MRRDTSTEPEELDRPEGNSLLENYELHDHGEREFVRRVEELGFTVEPWGIDMRDDDGNGLVYDDKLDFKVYDEDNLIALVDVKTKSSPRWMGRFNLRHFEHYKEHADEYDVPTFVVMFQTNNRGDIHDEFVFDINVADEHSFHSSKDSDAVRQFPDGNNALLIKHDARRRWTHLVAQIMFETRKNESDMTWG